MAEDNVVLSKLGALYRLDENINSLNVVGLHQVTSTEEGNHNTVYVNSESIIKKLKEISITNNSAYSCSHRSENLLSSKTDPSTSHSDDSDYQDHVNNDLMHVSSDYTKTEAFHNHTENKRHSLVDPKQTPEKSTVLKNLSEAGPDVAEFSEEELRTVAELLKEPTAFDFLHKASTSKLLQESPVGRLSQFVKLESAYKSALLEGNAQDSGLDISGDSNSLNIACGNEKDHDKILSNLTMATDSSMVSGAPIQLDNNFITSIKMDRNTSVQQSVHTQEHKLFTEEEFTQALKMQELLLHEKQLKREKDRGDVSKALEKDKQMIKNQLVTLSKGYRASRGSLEELLNVFTMWLSAKEHEHVEMTNNTKKTVKERDQALEDLQSVESAFADLHRRYGNCKSVLEGYKQNEDRVKAQMAELHMKLKHQEEKYDMLRSRIQDKLDSANAEIENAKKSGDAEVTVLRAQLKKAEMKITSLEKDLEQKNNENIQLGSICDDLIAKVGKT